ncbi:MAG TPA: 16S rRNA (guanine(527)-N(7))-methyltransferase RsmG [Bacteroidales bacterium]|nr:16S rRNA (guanine(527)-N(7))-methyltransferase RsmG [Bacteroidales bacterium]
MITIAQYFPNFNNDQLQKIDALLPLYQEWNSQINVISRKDMDNFYAHHVLHSLAIAKAVSFKAGTRILDVGTGGGFPGIPLAIAFPDAQFLLVDSVGKKIKVVKEVAAALGLQNIDAQHSRAEEIGEEFDFVVCRAVTQLPVFVQWVKPMIKKKGINDIPNGILYLKGGDFHSELQQIPYKSTIFDLSQWFSEPFFETKKLVHLYR